MRSRSAPGLPGRCKTCWIKDEYCICGTIETVHTPFAISIIRHVREAFKTTNTARIAQLALPAVRIFDYGAQGEGFDASALVEPGTFLLFPTKEPTTVRPEAVRRLLVVDGTWGQARTMVKRIPGLLGLPKISVASNHLAALRLRSMPFPGGLTTLEALAAAVGLLEGEEKARRLHEIHDRFVSRVLKARGTLKVAL